MQVTALLKSWDDTGVLGYTDEYRTLVGAKALFRSEIERGGEVARAYKIEGQDHTGQKKRTFVIDAHRSYLGACANG